jgi:hypothetical protein
MKNLYPNIQEQFDELSKHPECEFSENEIAILRKILDICDSPIEQMFLIGISKYWMSTQPFQLGKTLGARSKLENFMSLDYIGAVDVTIYPQYWITAGEKNYRADLFLQISGRGLLSKRDGSQETINREINLIVEIDGHNFHEKTKEQAQNDKSRDRVLKKYGYEVIHYTGSEVYQDVYKVTRELAEFILAKLFSVTNVYDLFYEL